MENPHELLSCARTAPPSSISTSRPRGRSAGSVLTGGSDVVDGHVALHALRLGRAVVTSDPDGIALFAPQADLVVV